MVLLPCCEIQRGLEEEALKLRALSNLTVPGEDEALKGVHIYVVLLFKSCFYSLSQYITKMFCPLELVFSERNVM